jgi:hypothetical protein
MDGMWIQNIIAVIAIFLIPMTGLTIILTARLALKPLVETLSKALRESGLATSPDLLNEVQRLSEKIEFLEQHVERLEAAQEFDRKLLEAPADEAWVKESV